MDSRKLGVKLQELILRKIDGGKFTVPALPRVAQEVRDRLDDANVDLKVVGTTIEKDPVIAAQVIKIASSPLYRSKDNLTGIQQAVARLGIKKLKEVLIAACARQVFSSRRMELREAMMSLWTHSMAVAHLSRDISNISGMKEHEAAYLGGLLHDIGKPIAGAYLAEVETALSGREARTWIDGASFLEVVGEIHSPIGVAVAEAWEMPPEVTGVIKDSGEYDAGNRESPTNAVRFANALSKLYGFGAGDFDEKQVTTQIMIGRSLLGIEEGVAEELARKHGGEVSDDQ